MNSNSPIEQAANNDDKTQAMSAELIAGLSDICNKLPKLDADRLCELLQLFGDFFVVRESEAFQNISNGFPDVLKAIKSAHAREAAKRNTGHRASRYASEESAWLEAAKAAAASSTAPTSAGRKRAAKRAIKVISPNVGDDAVLTFFAKHWREIYESHR